MNLKLKSKVSAPLHSSSKKSPNKLLTYVDTSDIKIHPNVDIAVVPVPQSTDKIILVRDVFAHPTKVRNLILQTPVHKEPFFAFPGYRAALRWEFGELPSFLNYILQEFYNREMQGVNFHSNVICPQEKIIKSRLVPHVDDMNFGFSIWLNTPEEISTKKLMPGTAFYRHKIYDTCSLDIEKNPDKYDSFVKEYQDTWGTEELVSFDSDNIDSDVWEKYFLSPMIYNTMVLYPGKLFHQAFVKPNYFPNCERISLAGLPK